MVTLPKGAHAGGGASPLGSRPSASPPLPRQSGFGPMPHARASRPPESTTWFENAASSGPPTPGRLASRFRAKRDARK